MSFPTGHNPYSAPETDIELIDTPLGGDLAEAELIRRQYIKHEASVKSIGLLDFLGCIGLFIVGLVMLGTGGLDFGASRMPEADRQSFKIVMMGVGVFLLVMSIAMGFAGAGIRRLRPWTRWFHVVGSCLSLVQFVLTAVLLASRPEGANQLGRQFFPVMINLYILYLLLSAKGGVVFSASYRDIVEKTPHIRAGTSLFVKIFVGIFVTVIGIAIIGGVIGALTARR